MGVHGWTTAFPPHGYLSLKQLKGLTLAIDAMGEIYRALLGTAKIHQLTDSKGNPTNYINTIIGVIGQLYTAGAEQIWVFDNGAHPLKIALLERAKNRKKAAEALKILVEKKELRSDDEDIDDEKKKNQLEKQVFRVDESIINNVIRVLNGFGIRYVMSPPGIEAEHVAAHMVKQGLADAVLTNDPDAIVFGAPRVIMRNRNKATKKSKSSAFVEYYLNILLETNKLKRKDLPKIAVALKCDFYDDTPDPDDENDDRPYFKGIGPKTILSKLKHLKDRDKFSDPKVKAAINVFLSDVPPYIVVGDPKIRPFRSSKKINELITWLVDELGFNSDLIVSRFKKTYELDRIKYKKPGTKRVKSPALKYVDV
jgi:5'-3' exonuclease